MSATTIQDETHCGYTNYETFSVALHIDNTEKDYLRVQDKIVQLLASETKERAILSLQKWLRPVYSCVIKTGRRKINWNEIATDQIESYLEDQAYEERRGEEIK